MAATDLMMSYAAFHQWLGSSGEDNREERGRVKKMLPSAMNECVTDIQRTYILRFFIDGLTIYQIADQYGVCASTVSRGIHAGLNRLADHLRFASPAFVSCITKTDLRKRRKP